MFGIGKKRDELMDEYEERYGAPEEQLPEGVENDDPEYESLFEALSESGVEPSGQGWVPSGTFDPEEQPRRKFLGLF